MNLLLTGAGGFIGTNFIKLNRQDSIIPFSFRHDDINSADLSTIDAVIHLAALVHQTDTLGWEDYESINVAKTVELAKKARDSGVKQFLFMSTVKVFGEENDLPYVENSSCDPQDHYGKSKLMAEQELQKLSNNHFTVSIIRTPVVYGPGVKGNILSLIRLIQRIRILPFKDINNRRSIVFVGNLCSMIDTVLSQKSGGVFLAADDRPLSTTDLISKIADVMDKKIFLVRIPGFDKALKFLAPTLHQRLYGNLYVDNRRTLSQLSFHNPYTAEEGIAMMIQGDSHA